MPFHTEIQNLNLPAIAGAAEQVGAFRDRRQDAQQARSDRRGFRAATPGILSGDEASIQEGAALDPQATAQLLDVAGKMNAAELADSKKRAVDISRLVLGVLNAAPQDRPAAYQAAIAQAGQSGLDVSNLPPQYSPDLEPRLKVLGFQALDIGEFFKMVEDRNSAQSAPGKVQADIDRGLLPAGTPLRKPGSPLVSVNTGPQGQDFGKPPKDFVWAREPDGSIALRTDPATGFASPVAIPIAGGPEQAKREGAAEKAEKSQQGRVVQSNIVTQDIDRALDIVETTNIPVTGAGSFLSFVPGTPAKDLSALLDTIKANVGFDKLQAMREASPTGGALGQVSENENRLLQSVFGSLDQAQSEDTFKFNLRRLRETLLDIVHGPGNRPGQAPQVPTVAPAAAATAPSVQEGATATNPTTGEKLIFQGGKWVPSRAAPNLPGGAKKKLTDEIEDRVKQEFKAVAPFDLKVVDSREQGISEGRKLEFYAPGEARNPFPGRPTVEVFDPAFKGADLTNIIAADFLHHLVRVDPRARSLREEFRASMTPEQTAVDRQAYQRAVAGDFGSVERRPFGEWFEQHRLDQYLGAMFLPKPNEWENFYTPDQEKILMQIETYLRTGQ